MTTLTDLPVEIQRYIFSFDATYRECFGDCIDDLDHLFGVMKALKDEGFDEVETIRELPCEHEYYTRQFTTNIGKVLQFETYDDRELWMSEQWKATDPYTAHEVLTANAGSHMILDRSETRELLQGLEGTTLLKIIISLTGDDFFSANSEICSIVGEADYEGEPLVIIEN